MYECSIQNIYRFSSHRCKNPETNYPQYDKFSINFDGLSFFLFMHFSLKAKLSLKLQNYIKELNYSYELQHFLDKATNYCFAPEDSFDYNSYKTPKTGS